MGFFTKKKHRFTSDCLEYVDLESEIVGEVQRIIKSENIDELPQYEEFLRTHEEERKHLLKLFEIAEGCDEIEMVCFLMVARKEYPNMWHKVNAYCDKEMRTKLAEFEKINEGKQ